MTTIRSEIVMIDVAAIAFVTGNAGFTLTPTLGVTLEAARSDRIAMTSYAVFIFALVVIFATAFAIRTVPIGGAVEAVPSVTGSFV